MSALSGASSVASSVGGGVGGGGQGGFAFPNVGSLYNNYLQAANSAYGQISAGYQNVLGQVKETLGQGGTPWGVAGPAAQAIGDLYAQQSGGLQQQNLSAGIGNTTVANQLQRGPALDAGKAYAGLGANLAQTYAGYEAQLGTAPLSFLGQSALQYGGALGQLGLAQTSGQYGLQEAQLRGRGGQGGGQVPQMPQGGGTGGGFNPGKYSPVPGIQAQPMGMGSAYGGSYGGAQPAVPGMMDYGSQLAAGAGQQASSSLYDLGVAAGGVGGYGGALADPYAAAVAAGGLGAADFGDYSG